jgi:thiamine-phosphate pyrophosphorylase
MNSPIVCYVSDRRSLPQEDRQSGILEKIKTAAIAGVDWIQIREKDLRTYELLELTREAVRSVNLANSNARVLVNDRVDIALSAGASGVHLGNASLRAREIVNWLRSGNAPPEFLIGVSCHRLEEVQEGTGAGADYVFFGPVFDTPSKRDFGAPQGIAELGAVTRAVRIPVIAIGGIDEENAMKCIAAGAAGIAAIRFFQEPRGHAQLLESVAALHRLPRH